MKKWMLLLIMLGVVSCQIMSNLSAPTPTPTITTKCVDNVCIKNVMVTIENNYLRLEFNLVDENGEVRVGDEPAFSDEMLLAIYRVEEKTYLWGGKIPPGMYKCYAGNDIPWSEGKLASTCGVTIPASQFQYSVSEGEKILVDVPKYRLEHVVIIGEP